MDNPVTRSPLLWTTPPGGPGSRPPLRRPAALVALAALAFGLGCSAPSSDPTAGPARRVVCLTPSSTELVVAVAGPGVIVGVDDYSAAEVAAVRGRPTVGDFLAPSLEAILRLRPDLVVLDRVQTRVADGLRAAGVRALPLRMERVGDVAAGLRAVGDALGRRAEAAAAAARLEAEIAAVRAEAARALGGRPPPRVLIVVDRELGGLGNLVAAGPNNYLDELVALAGGVNVLADAPVAFPRISVEEVLRRAPEVIIDAVHTADQQRAAADWDVLATVPAVATGRVHVLADTMYTHPGPRLAESLRGLARRIHAPPRR